MNADPFGRLLSLLDRLDKAKIPYQMRHSRDDAIMIVAFAPGQYWEIDIMQDGEMEIERYRSDGVIDDESVLQDLFDLWSDDVPKSKPAEERNDAVA
jgi:hypothetical protein